MDHNNNYCNNSHQDPNLSVLSNRSPHFQSSSSSNTITENPARPDFSGGFQIDSRPPIYSYINNSSRGGNSQNTQSNLYLFVSKQLIYSLENIS